MDPLKLLITDNTVLLSEKGTILIEKTFASDEECATLIATELSKRKKASVRGLFCGSRVTTQTKTSHFSQPEPFTADDKELHLIIESATHEFLETHKDKELTIIQTEVVELFLNGYPVKKLDKQKANDMSVTLFFAALPSSYIKNLKAGMGGAAEHSTFSSFSWFQAAHVQALAKLDDFITCSVFELSTDISIRKNGLYFETVTVPMGTHHAEEHAQKGLPLDDFKHALNTALEAGLVNLCNGISLPSKVFLLVAPTYQEAFADAFRNDSYHSICFSEKGFEVANMSSILSA